MSLGVLPFIGILWLLGEQSKRKAQPPPAWPGTPRPVTHPPVVYHPPGGGPPVLVHPPARALPVPHSLPHTELPTGPRVTTMPTGRQVPIYASHPAQPTPHPSVPALPHLPSAPHPSFPLHPVAPPFVDFHPPPMDDLRPPPQTILHPVPPPPTAPHHAPPEVVVSPIEISPPEEPLQKIAIVKPGEGLSQVAKRLGRPGTIDDVRALRAANIPHGPDADWSSTATGNLQKKGRPGGLQPGDKLFVPEGWA